MKIVILVLVLFMTNASFAAKGKFKDDQMLREISSEFWEHWNKHDVKAMAAMFNDEASYLSLAGKLESGKKEVEKSFREEHESALKEANASSELKSIQFVARNVAILDEEVEITGMKNPDGKVSEGLMKLFSSSILMKKTGKWWLAGRRAWVMPVARETSGF